MLNGIPVGSGPLRGVAHVFRSADFTLANLEVPLTDAETPTRRKTPFELKARTQFILKGDPRHTRDFPSVGLDLLSLANNHAMDYGPKGLAQERAILARLAIGNAGAGPNGEAAAALAISTSKDGFRVGLLSALAFVGRGSLRKCGPAGPGRPGVNVLAFDGRIDDGAKAKLKGWVGSARSRCDYLVVALHWGIERQPKPTAYQIALGRAVVDAGADLVWGAHPHVLQPTELYKGTPILYSTGNLVSPLPGKTALFRLVISDHRTISQSRIPVKILNGKALLGSMEARKVRRKRILSLKARRAGH